MDNDTLMSASEAPPQVGFSTGEPAATSGNSSPSNTSVVFENGMASFEVSTPPADSAEKATWYWAEGIPGVGPKPEGFQDSKYKYVLNQAQAYNPLREKLGHFSGAPEEYSYDVTMEGLNDVEIDKESTVVQALEQFAKKNQMSQEGFSDLINGLAYLNKQEEQKLQEMDNNFYAEQKKLLGEKAETRLAEISQWTKQQGFSEKTLDAMKKWAQTASDVEAIEEIRSKMVYTPIAPIESPSYVDNQFTIQDRLKNQMKDQRYGYDKAFTDNVDKQYQKIYGGK